MKTKEIIANLTNLAKVIRKDIDMPYELRRAMRKNYNTLSEEYKIYEAERSKLIKQLKEGENEKEIEEKLEAILETEVDINIIKVSETLMETVVCSASDEMAIQFMLVD